MIHMQHWLIIFATISSIALSSCASNQAGPESQALKSSIDVVWQMDVDNRKPQDAQSFARPMVSTVGKETYVAIGGLDRRMHVLSLSGSEKFRVPLIDNSDSGGIALSNGLLVVGDSGGMLYAIDPDTKKISWQLQLSAGITATPLNIGDDVLIQTIDDNIYRISAKGKKQWVFSAKPETLGLYISPTPLLKDGKLYTFLGNGDALALDAETGNILWRKQLLLDSRSGALSDIKIPSASPLWVNNVKIEGNEFHDVLLMPFYQGDIFILDRSSGSSLMTHKLSLKSPPATDGSQLFLASSEGQVQAWDIESGIVSWSKNLSEGELMGPVLWNDSLWVQDNKGYLFRLNKKGELLASKEFPGRFDRLPATTSNGLLYHSNFGGLYLVR